MVAGHEVQHGKAVHARHDQVQQHQSDVATVLVEPFQCFLAVGRFQDAIVLLQDLGQDGPVHGRIIHDQDLLLLLRQLFRVLGLSLRVGHHHGILAVLGLVHQQVGPAHGRLNGVGKGLEHAADAHGRTQVRITRHLCLMDAAADLLQLFGQLFCRDARQQQQELVAAKADQGVGLADAVADDPRHCFQHQITCMVAVGVIVDLEVVQIHHRHTGRTDQAAHRFFVVAPVVYAGEGVAVKLGGIARDAADEVFAVLHVQHRSAMGALDHLQHIGFAVHFVIPGDHLGNVRVKKFQPRLLGAGAQGLLGRTVPGDVFLVAAGIAEIFSAGVGAFPLLYAFHRRFVQQAHVGIDLPQIPDQCLNLLHRFHFSFPSNIRYLPQRDPPSPPWSTVSVFSIISDVQANEKGFRTFLLQFYNGFSALLLRYCCIYGFPAVPSVR